MIEFLVFIGLFFLAGAVLLVVAKLLFALVLIPFKLGFLMLKGVVGLVLFVPALIVGIFVVIGVLPLLLGLIALPVLAGVGILVCLIS